MDKDKIYLKHIIDSINLISKFIFGMNKQTFVNNEVVISATIRQLEVVGEAVKNISKELRKKYPKIPWKQAAGTRDNLIHEYFNVDLNQVWETIKINLPELKEKVNQLLKKI